MSIVWIGGGLSYWKTNERIKSIPELIDGIPITILVPCHNESKTIELTCTKLLKLNYSNYNVIFIDDGSTDDTVDFLRLYTNRIHNFHLLILEKNVGKAQALNIALDLVKSPYVLVMDADTILTPDALSHFIRPFIYRKNIGAVTGNPIPLNRTNLLSKFQTAEFMSIIGLINRTHHVLGKMFTVSGCATMYDVNTLKNVNGFSPSTATEDIDITWKIQRVKKGVYFESKAVVYIQVPNKFKEYIKQRKRWALGGWHMLRSHKQILITGNHIRLKLIYLDFIIAYLWCFCFTFTLAISVFSIIFMNNSSLSLGFIWHGSLATFLCLCQMVLAIYLNRIYDNTLTESLTWVPWYSLLFFMVSAFLVVLTFPKGLFGNLKNTGIWSSPQRNAQ